VHLLIVRVGSARDRIYSGGHVEAGYRPDPRAREIVDTLAADAHARAFTSVASAAAALRTEASAGHEALRGTQISTRPLARYVVLLAFVPLAVLIRRRNFAAL
jgi:hypothetical protein